MRPPRITTPSSLALLLTLLTLLGATPGATAAVRQERLAPGERAEVDFMRRHGDLDGALEVLAEVLEEDPGDALSRALFSRALFDAARWEESLEEAQAAFAAAQGEGYGPRDSAHCLSALVSVLLELGRADEARTLLQRYPGLHDPQERPEDAWLLGRVLLEAGDRPGSVAAFEAGTRTRLSATWQDVLARARCQRALGQFRRAAESVVAAEKMAFDGEGVEAELLVELGSLYFEAYGEVDDAASRSHSPVPLYREALEIDPDHEGALLGLFQLYRFNWQRVNHSPGEFLDSVLQVRPDSIRGLLLQASSALDDGNLPQVRDLLERLGELAPGRRDVRTQRAALAWVEHRRDEAQAILDELLAVDGGDSRPEREVGRHLLELYRFAEARPFLESAVKRDAGDYQAWTELGRAQANTGAEDEARESLDRAVKVAGGRRNAWRDNMLLVLRRMEDAHVEHESGALTFSWLPEAAPLFEIYLDDFYTKAREELSRRYGFTPDPTRIEVFRRWNDFSVRSTGYEGYPALGVCFGPVVTAVSPLSELRGSFSWARTSFHEFTHVIHLGLSHNRCPRWITEGLATWEEGNRNPSWWRNMRRELVDAHANDDLIRVRRLNNAFRGPRVLFAYYQSGLLCRMLIERHGFAPMVRLLEAFDRGADLDGALGEIFGRTPEEMDAELRAYTGAMIAELAIEPRWTRENTFRTRFRLPRKPPTDEAAQADWADQWSQVAWGFHAQGQALDAGEALRLAGTVGDLPPRGAFLQGELALERGDATQAQRWFEAGFAAGGEDYRARMAMGTLALERGKRSEAEQHFRAAQAAFPGFADARFSAELQLARLYEARGEREKAMQARRRWLDFNAGDYDIRVQVAEWFEEVGKLEQAHRTWEEANEVDPFRRHLHLSWGRVLAALGRDEEALREFTAGLLVTEALDGDVQLADAGGSIEEILGLSQEEVDALTPTERTRRVNEALSQPGDGMSAAKGQGLGRFHAQEPLLHGRKAQALHRLGRVEGARSAAETALALDPRCEPALRVLEALESPGESEDR